ncbi:Protein of unknown function [Pyronema omphalodes CBS 100304]|uniref:Uncharacterized protein n=1 Tax=Pyronema omphalodes (strain CBS 100304) TaxID=1076935 RepID=U4L5D2_PYROM|nr:Protein of unknown function [Pyronema omphalodes CBS 100304]
MPSGRLGDIYISYVFCPTTIFVIIMTVSETWRGLLKHLVLCKVGNSTKQWEPLSIAGRKQARSCVTSKTP